MINYVFVGSEAEGYYSNSYACEGVFLTKNYYERNKEEIETAFEGRTFYELDGKHSEVDGDLLVRDFDNVSELLKFTSDSDVSYEVYHLSEYDDRHDDHVIKTYEAIEELVSHYKTYQYVLTPEQHEKVQEFVEELTKGDR